ncbi:MAG: hypothetical protein GXO82_07105 [Chlorobi bacterium]|nr:hypothetical protein [Chlorobiota bacterium]
MHSCFIDAKLTALSLFAVLLVSVASAQSPKEVFTGPRGAFITCGKAVLPGAVDGKALRAYRVERREKGSPWEILAEVAGPTSFEDLNARLLREYDYFPQLKTIKINVAMLWERLKASRELRSAGMLSQVLPIQLVLGVRWLDTTVQKGKTYEYRVSTIDEDGKVVQSETKIPVTYPREIPVPSLRVLSTFADESSAGIHWLAGPGVPPSTFSVYRRFGISGPFKELSPNFTDSCCVVAMGISRRHDSTVFILVDHTIEPGQVYQYYATATDFFQNPGAPSDTTTIVTFNMAAVPLPEFLTAESDDTSGIRLSWRLRDTSAVHGIIIERGPALDSGFVELYTAGPTDTTFLDITVEPATMYYYRFRLVGPGNKRSGPSAVIFGLFNETTPPAPPTGLTATPVRGGVRLSWDVDSTQNLEGCIIYRANGLVSSMRQISPMLPPDASSYVDTSTGLRGKYTYFYSMVAVNTSHVQGPPSDTVSAVPLIPVPVSSPMGVRTVVLEDGIFITWNGQRGEDPELDGFRVYRKTGTSDKWKPLTDTLLEAWQNSFRDTTVIAGNTYSYAVRAYSIRMDSSALSMTATARVPTPEIFPPANPRARFMKKRVYITWDEIVQPAAAGFRLYRYTRGRKPVLVATLSPDDTEYVDRRPGKTSPVFYFITTVDRAGHESKRSKEMPLVIR